MKTGAALKSILKNPMPFLGNLVRAAKLGFSNFADNFGTHLKAGLIDWLTGSLQGVYIPKAATLPELGKMAMSVLGITWAQIRGKIVTALGPNGERIMFIALLDIQIVSASLRDIGGGLSAGADDVAWIQTAYLIAEIVVIPLSGWLSRVFSTRWLFAASAAGFTITSLLCGAAWDIQSMIVFRAAQGFLGGSMIPTVFTTAFVFFEGKQRVIAAATIGAIASLAPTLGPTLGGWITDHYSWHWLFFINLVPGVFVAIAVPLLVKIDEPDLSLLKSGDWAGIALIAVFLGCLEYTLEEGPRWNWLEDSTIRTTAWVSLVAGVLFVWRGLTAEHPVVDLRALKDRNFALGCFFSFVTGIGLFATIYLTPLFLGRVEGYSAFQIGKAVFSTGVFQILSIPVYAFLANRVDLRWLLMFGLALFTASMIEFMADAVKWAARLPVPGYALDDDTAIKVVDGAVELVSEGQWKLFER